MVGMVKEASLKVDKKSRGSEREMVPTEPLLIPMVADKVAMRATFGRRKESFEFQSIDNEMLPILKEEGWEVHKEGVRRTRIKKSKELHAQLEDQLWSLLYRLGYPELSGSDFQIQYVDSNGVSCKKSFSVFAKDDETVIVAICKSRESRGKKTLQKELSDLQSIQKSIANAVRKHYGSDFRPKIIWMCVTQNIIWSEQDLERANSANIRVVTENELQYFDAFARHMGPAGRFQFLAEFLEGQEIPELADVKVPATKGTLGNHVFYSFVTTPRHLLKVAFVNHQALNHPTGRPTYQRMVSPARIKEIGEFIRKGGYFPTNLLVNFTEKCRFDLLPNKENSHAAIKFGWLHLPHKYKSAWVIDGQHRLYGYSHLDDRFLDQSIAVIAFEKMETTLEAELFVTINQKQKSVQKSVIVSLQSDLKWGSSDPKERASALASRLAKTLSSDPTSPFFQRFSIQGVTAKENQSLTIPELVNGLNRSNLLGKASQKNWVAGVLSSSTDDRTVERARRFINIYFTKVRAANPERWDAAKQGYVATNPGIRAHLLLLAELFKHLEEKQGQEPSLLEVEDLMKAIDKYLAPVLSFLADAGNADIYDRFARKFGEGGVREYADNLNELIHKKHADFGSEEFLERLQRKSVDRVRVANQDIIDLSKALTDHTISVLKKHYGTAEASSGDKAYWEQGIESSKIKEEAYVRQLQDKSPVKGGKENYLQILDLKAIVKQRTNWPLFEATFSIPLAGEKGKTYYLDWMEKFNELRRIPAHPSSTRGYSNEDLEFLQFVKSEFYSRLEQDGAK
jgi:DNA sulfur modification protein DndB